MRFVVLGTSEFTLSCLQALIDSKAEVCGLISLPKEDRPLNSADIRGFAKERGIDYQEAKDINSQAAIEIVKSYQADYLFSSWPKILSKEVLAAVENFCIGSHPGDLPFNRGRHPLHWLIALGINQTKLSFFIVDQGIDSGKILLQVPLEIDPGDTIDSLNSKLNTAGYQGTAELCQQLRINPLPEGLNQDQGMANYWRKRSSHDITLDLRMSADMILRTVRSFASPYPCANLIFENQVIKISQASIVDDKDVESMEHGKIIGVCGKKIRIKVDDAVIELESKDPLPTLLNKAGYIHPPGKYLLKWPKELASQL